MPPESSHAANRSKRSGWWVLYLLAPHLVFGCYLVLVPDRIAFTLSQLIVLAHVLIALLTVPLIIGWTLRHIKLVRTRERRRKRKASPGSLLVWGMLTVFGLGSLITGVAVLWSGAGMSMGKAHALMGLALAIPVALHLFLDGKKTSAIGVSAALVLTVVGALVIDRGVEGEPELPLEPDFAFKTRSVDLYESAQWCGECHTEIYEEWSRSTHARTLQIENVRHDFVHQAPPGVLDLDLDALHGAIHGDSPLPDRAHEACVHCHAPVSFYGKDSEPILSASMDSAVGQGVTCAFCHTIRGVNPGDAMQPVVDGMQAGKMPSPSDIFPRMAFYVAAPETVRRYIGQASSQAPMRWLGNMLIRWRPEMHRRDYHSPILNTSMVCKGCHGLVQEPDELPFRSFSDWENGPYKGPDEESTVHCQDCHMARNPNGEKVVEAGKLVAWGPERKQRRSHYFLGGNVRAMLEAGDREMAALQREFSHKGMSISIEDVRQGPAAIEAKVQVTSEMNAHDFPSPEAEVRFAWVELKAFDASGKLIAGTKPWTRLSDTNIDSPLIFRKVKHPEMTIELDTLIPADESRDFDIKLALPEEAAPIAHVSVELRHGLDPEPIAKAKAKL